MPTKKTTEKARRALRSGKSPTTAAGAFVHEEIEHVREGKHGARSPEQAIAIGLSKARRAGIPLSPPPAAVRARRPGPPARRDVAAGKKRRKSTTTSCRRSRAMLAKLEREPRSTVSHRALSAHAKRAARRRR